MNNLTTTKHEVSALRKFRNKLLGAAVLCSASMVCAAPMDQLDSLSTNLQTVATKAETISGYVISAVTVAVIMAIVVGWLKKGKKAGNG